MGYCVTMNESTIKIKPENVDGILKALGNYTLTRDLYFVDSCKVMMAENIFEIMKAIRYPIYLRNGAFEIDYFNGEKLGNDFEIFTQIAPYIEDGYIEYQGEDGALWRYVFENGKVKEVYPKIIWE